MYKSKAKLILSFLTFSFVLGGCNILNTKSTNVSTRQEFPNVSEIITEEDTKKSLEEMEDTNSLIAEPGLEIDGVIESITETLVTITSSNDYKSLKKDTSINNLEKYIQRELCYSPSTLYYSDTKGIIKSITKAELKENDRVRYSFTIAATGEPMLYSITVIK